MKEDNKTVPRERGEIKLTPAGEAQFWAKVDKSAGPDACWIWTASKARGGYGTFGIKRRLIGAHRIAWILANGQIPHDGSYHGICVCHKCDNPPCCNPSHLFLGTNADNARDKTLKGRGNYPRGDKSGSRKHPQSRPRGESHTCSKITDAQVLEIRALYAAGGITKAALAKKFGMGPDNIRAIVQLKTWKHVISGEA